MSEEQNRFDIFTNWEPMWESLVSDEATIGISALKSVYHNRAMVLPEEGELLTRQQFDTLVKIGQEQTKRLEAAGFKPPFRFREEGIEFDAPKDRWAGADDSPENVEREQMIAEMEREAIVELVENDLRILDTVKTDLIARIRGRGNGKD